LENLRATFNFDNSRFLFPVPKQTGNTGTFDFVNSDQCINTGINQGTGEKTLSIASLTKCTFSIRLLAISNQFLVQQGEKDKKFEILKKIAEIMVYKKNDYLREQYPDGEWSKMSPIDAQTSFLCSIESGLKNISIQYATLELCVTDYKGNKYCKIINAGISNTDGRLVYYYTHLYDDISHTISNISPAYVFIKSNPDDPNQDKDNAVKEKILDIVRSKK